ncbi:MULTISPECIES: hypothetical protein [unclassified Janthinobacterium]|uniref:hypothetical protein n=1 Tax=unclassified Janthinobacterium TaxID=2610881 RepID=UPI001621D565|nr:MULTISPECIES: hypothetical protein [unclassified Janthinobacterium]MBB5610415.1 hypothetical protein [Janthinobacterium sp. S3T4]MBB5615748.1 hypothetical protein [Janthinobacterium sp. S3M3]
MKITIFSRLAQYGKFTIEATALKIESSWYPRYRITDGLLAPDFSEHQCNEGYPSTEAAVDIAVQHAMFDLDFGGSLPA